MNANDIAIRLAHVLATPLRNRSLIRRSAPLWLGLLVTAGSLVPRAPSGGLLPEILPEPPVTFAGYPCSSHSGEWPTFTGHISNSSGTQLSESTSGNVYGRISNVDRIWQPTPGCGYYRYDAILWATDNSTTDLTVDWGALSGDGLGCTFLLNTSDYINSDSQSCGTSSKLVVSLDPEWTYQNDSALNTKGDFAFAHADCITWYGVEPIKTGATTSVTSGEPGANCGNKSLDGTNTTQTLVVDGTAPSLSFTFPPSGGPTVNPAAWTSVVFSATDAVAGFGGSDDWDLQRQKANISGATCDTTWNNDGTALSGITNGSNQVSSQSLELGKCYRWTLGARDENGNTAATITSGTIRTDTSGVRGDQSQFRMEAWDLGGGDTLAVSVGSSNLRLIHPIVSLPIRNGSLDLVASYNSHDTGSIGLGTGWRLNVQRRLAVDPPTGDVTFIDADGSRHVFDCVSTCATPTYTRPATLYATLTRDTAATPDRFTLTYRDQSKDVFDELATGQGYLKEAKDRHGNTSTIAYTGTVMNTLTDPAGRPVTFNWTGTDLTSIVDWANINGSGIVQTSGTPNRTHRFFYSGANLVGWANALNPNTGEICPLGASGDLYLTCLTYANGLLTSISKKQTFATMSGGVVTTGTWSTPPTTTIAYASASSPDVASVTVALTDSANATSTFSHASGATESPAQTKVVRPGTPASETTYTLVSMSDDKGRIGTVERKLGGSQVKQVTTYNGTYPIEPASVIDNYVNGIAGDGSATVEDRIVNYTYQASSLGLLSKLDEPLEGTNRRHTDYTYNANNDVTRILVYQASAPSSDTETRFCYTTSGCSTSATDLVLRSKIENYVDGSAGGANGHFNDVTTAYQYDTACAGGTTCGQRIRETRSNYSGGTLVNSAVTGWTYESNGNVNAEIRNYVSGTVSSPGDDITPNGGTNVRTDLTTTYTYDTAGNRVSSADPRRAIEAAKGACLAVDDYITRASFDALNQSVTSVLPTTPEADCTPPSDPRNASTTYDELGLVRESSDISGLVTATRFDKGGRPIETYEDAVGSTAALSSASTYDAQGRLLTAHDRRQVATSTLGSTFFSYDELSRVTDVTAAYGSSPDLASITHSTYDNLDRKVTEEIGYLTGTGQKTTWTHDIGGRLTKIDDEFTCAITTYDYRHLPLVTKEGLDPGTCATPAQREITNSYDGLGRLTNSAITTGEGLGDILAAPTYDSFGHLLSTSATKGTSQTSSTFTFNPLDQPYAETRAEDATTASWTKSNFDPAGNLTDRCVWNVNPDVPSVELCKAVGQTFTTTPSVHTTAAYDARNNRVSLKIPGAGETTYDPLHNYQLDVIYVPTKLNGSNQVIAEHGTNYDYDNRHRLLSIAQSVCPVTANTHICTGANVTTATDTYSYDDNDNRTQVIEGNVGSTTTTTNYCYDAVDRLRALKLTSSCTITSGDELYEYDDAGNRQRASLSSAQYFRYSSEFGGQLCEQNTTQGSCPTDKTTWQIKYDDAGRTKLWNGWNLSYDGEGRLASACKVSGCATNDMVTMRYDASGKRVELVVRPNGQSATTTLFRYQGNAIAQEVVASTVTRTYVTDESGAIVKFCDPDCAGTNPHYLVTWNGHGDALAIWRVDASTGTLTLANSFTYTTWGAPTTATHNNIADLGFRFLYVGQYGVAWDNALGLGLEYMSARHYSPVLGRFLQPDPSAAEANLYSYAANSPITRTDPSGRDTWEELSLSTPPEQMVCGWFPIDCQRWKLLSFQVWVNTADYNGQKANAMRHCVWSCVMTYKLGISKAWLFAWAHEVGDTKQGQIGLKLDLHNNRVGRLFGEQLRNQWWTELFGGVMPAALRLCSDAYRRGWLWIRPKPDERRITWTDGRQVVNPTQEWSIR